jgi:hypothetical protein
VDVWVVVPKGEGTPESVVRTLAAEVGVSELYSSAQSREHVYVALPRFDITYQPVALGATYAGYELGIWRFNCPETAEYPVQGIDVSHHQGQIDWQAVGDSGIQFAYIKATEAEDYRDPQFSTNWREAQNSGIARDAYHYFTFGAPGGIKR